MEKLKEFLRKKTSKRIFTKTQGILRKTQGYANCKLEIVAEKCPKKSLNYIGSEVGCTIGMKFLDYVFEKLFEKYFGVKSLAV